MKKNWLVVIISILIGSFSHLFWDNFTHKDGFFVEKLTFLTKSIKVYNIDLYVFKILQHLSTLAGSIIIAIVLLRLPKNEKVNSKVDFGFLLRFHF